MILKNDSIPTYVIATSRLPNSPNSRASVRIVHSRKVERQGSARADSTKVRQAGNDEVS